MATQTRKPEASKHLDASLVPLKNALLWRAKELDTQATAAQELPAWSYASDRIAQEFRALAEELHHW